MELSIFSLIIIIFGVGLYGLFAVACLKALQIPSGFSDVAIFIICGGVFGSITMFLYGVFVADVSGKLNGTGEVLGMFVLSGLVATSSSVFITKLRSKHRSANDTMTIVGKDN